MAVDKSKTNQRVIVIPESEISFDVENSTFNQSALKAGTPIPSAATQLALTVTGELSNNISIKTVQPGYPSNSASQAGEHSGARTIWKQDSKAGTKWMGYDAPRSVSAWSDILYNDADIQRLLHIDCIKTSFNDSIVAVCQIEDTSTHAGSFDNRLEAIIMDADDGSFTRVLIESVEATPSQDMCPCILALPSGRLQAYRIITDSAGYLRMWYSDDGGVTWAHGGDGLLDEQLVNLNSLDRMRVTYNDGQVLLMILDTSGSQNEVICYASSDLGNSFVKTETLTPPATFDLYNFDITGVKSGGFCLFIQGYLASNDSLLSIYKISDAYQKWTAATSVEIATVNPIGTLPSDLTIFEDDSGVIQAYWNFFDLAASDGIYAAASYDGGITFNNYIDRATGEIASYSSSTSGTGLIELSGCYQRGRAIIFHKWETGSTASGGTAGIDFPDGVGMAALFLGGYTTISMPSADSKKNDINCSGWEKAYFPTEIPTTDTDWVVQGTELESVVGPPAALSVNSTSTTRRSYKSGSIATTSTIMECRFVVAPQGGSASSLETAVKCSVQPTGASTQKYSLTVRMSDTGFEVWDQSGTPSLISDSIVGAFSATPVEIWVGIDGTTSGAGACTVQYRMWDVLEEREWTKVLNAGADLGPLVAFTDASPALEWGALANHTSAAGTLASYWKQMLLSTDVTRLGFSGTIANAQLNPEDLRGINIAGTPYQGLKSYCYAKNGPTWRGEQWGVISDSDYSVENSLTNPSPRIGWRSADLTSQTLTFSIDTYPTYGPRKVLAIMLRDTNISEYELFGFNGTSYVTLGTVTNKVSTSTFIRNGSSVIPGTLATPPYLKHGEFIDGEFSYSDTTTSRRIRSHSEGSWSSSSTLKPVLRLADADVADLSVGSAASIIPNQCISLVELTTDYSRFRIVIPSLATYKPADSFFKIGSIVIGWAYPLGNDYAWGRSLITETPVEIIQTRDMQKKVKKLSPSIRKVSFAWPDGFDQTSIEADDNLDPDYVKIGTEAGASYNGTAYALEGMIREIGGEAGSVIYMPHVPALSSLTTFNRRRDALHGRFTMSDYTINTVQGEEHEDEVVRISTLTITEDV